MSVLTSFDIEEECFTDVGEVLNQARQVYARYKTSRSESKLTGTVVQRTIF
jgi:hypothetical protein